MAMPPLLSNEDELEDALSEPSQAATEALSRLPGDFLLLGVGGKMGPSLARLIRRASDALESPRRVIGVARFTSPQTALQLNRDRIETIPCDLLDSESVRRLPAADNIIYMTGMKFGGAEQAARMWAMNTLVPARLAERYAHSRWMAFSTGNVYGFTAPASAGSREGDLPEPVGEYGMSALGRERVLEFASRTYDIPMALVRLNYACDLRYGVLVDLARRIQHLEPIDLTMGYFNIIWQGDANTMALQALCHAACPPFVVNVTGPEILAVRDVCEQLGRLMGRPVRFAGAEAPAALLSNASEAIRHFGPPRVSADWLIRLVAHWISTDQPTLDKPTHFEARNGRF